MSNQLKTRNGIPFDFVDGLRIKGVDVTNWDKVFIDQGASYVGFQPVGNLVASNVQAAIAELESEKQSKSEPITTAINLRPGANQGIVWDNDAFGGTQDTASITLETASGEATKMRFKMTNDSDDNFEFTAKTPDGLTVFNNAMTLNGNVLLNAANYVDYTAPMISDYTALRAYTGNAGQVQITSNGLSGFFYYDASDTTSTDNGGTIIVSSNGRRWKRLYSGRVNVLWFMTAAQISAVQTNTWAAVSHVTAAIDAAILAAAGKELVFPPGTYRVNNQLSFTNHSIVGTPKKTILKAVDFDTSAQDVVRVAGAEKTTISGITIDCTFFTSINKATYPSLVRFFRVNSTELTVEQCDVLGDATFDIHRAVDTTGASYVTVKGCLIKDIKGEALAAVGYKLLIDGNRIINVRKHSVNMNRAVIAGQSEELIFVNNYVQDTEWVSTVYNSVVGIDCGGADRVVISNNIFKNVAVGTDFEAVSAGAGPSTDIICRGNVFTGDGTHGHGVWVNYAEDNPRRILIEGNAISGYGIGVACSVGRNIVISNNSISNCQSTSISLDATYDYNVVGNNISQTTGKGIVSSSVNDGYSGGVISGNNLSGVFTPEAISVTNYNTSSGSGGTLLPRQPVLVTNNIVHDTRSADSKASMISTSGHVVSSNNVMDYMPAFSSSLDVRYGNKYLFGMSGANTLSDLVNGSYEQEVDIVFRLYPGASLTIDFTSSNLCGNSSADFTASATGTERRVWLRARRVYVGYGAGRWLCQVSEGY